MTDREILEKYIDLEKSCLMDKEKKEVMDMLYKYKETFSLRDEVGTFPNIEVEIVLFTYLELSLDRRMVQSSSLAYLYSDVGAIN